MNFSINLNICRVCMKSKQCQQIFNDSVLNKKWLYTTHLALDADDDLPKQLCESCVSRLKISYDFIHTAQNSDKRLKEFLKKIHKDFDEVANTEKSPDENNDELNGNDELLDFLKPETNSEIKSVEKTLNNVKNESAIATVIAAASSAPSPTTSPTVSPTASPPSTPVASFTASAIVNKSKIIPVVISSILQKNNHENKIELSNDLIKNEQELDTETEIETQDFEVAIDSCEEGYQLYEGVNFVDTVEGLEAADVMNEPSISTSTIGIEEIQVQEYEIPEESIINNDTSSQNDEMPIRINAGEDGFLKEYEGSISDGGNDETIDYLDEVSYPEMHNSECDESQVDVVSESQHFSMKISNDLEEPMKPKTNRKSQGGRSTNFRATGKGRPALPANTRFLCIKCNRDFSTKTNLNRHLITHEGLKPYKCKVCSKSFTQNGTLKQHMLIHTGEKPYVCEFCNRAFNQSKSLVFHLRRHTGEKPFHCDFCNLDFRQKDGLKNHILRHHMGDSIGNKYLCIICKKVMVRKMDLQTHMKKHVNNHRSMSCGARQTGEQNAEVILELINENDEYGTEATTLYAEEMTLNVSNVTSATHVVDVTATSAVEPSRAKKYQCRKCFKCFAIKKNLIRHLSVHDMTVSEMFQCEKCQIAFDTNYALNLHLVRTHKQVVDNLNKCEECNSVFNTPAELNKHIDESHEYFCTECSCESFKTQKMLMEHMLEHELEDEEIMKLS